MAFRSMEKTIEKEARLLMGVDKGIEGGPYANETTRAWHALSTTDRKAYRKRAQVQRMPAGQRLLSDYAQQNTPKGKGTEEDSSSETYPPTEEADSKQSFLAIIVMA